LAYYRKVLQPGENVKVLGRLHWTVYAGSLTLLALGVAVTAVARSLPRSTDDDLAAMAALGVGLLMILWAVIAFLRVWIVRRTTEFVVTDRRIIYKRGLIARHTEEINIAQVETVDVDQGLWGRILGYGTVMIHGTGGSWEPLRRIGSPLTLRNAIVAR
jgi:uncharacterized membrane protein YdbT with pleckstrin-like domain